MLLFVLIVLISLISAADNDGRKRVDKVPVDHVDIWEAIKADDANHV